MKIKSLLYIIACSANCRENWSKGNISLMDQFSLQLALQAIIYNKEISSDEYNLMYASGIKSLCKM